MLAKLEKKKQKKNNKKTKIRSVRFIVSVAYGENKNIFIIGFELFIFPESELKFR